MKYLLQLKSNVFLFLITIFSLGTLIAYNLFNYLFWSPLQDKILNNLLYLVIILAGIYRWKPILILLIFLVPFMFFFGISGIFNQSISILKAIFSHESSNMYAFAGLITLINLFHVLTATVSILGYLFWQKEIRFNTHQ